MLNNDPGDDVKYYIKAVNKVLATLIKEKAWGNVRFLIQFFCVLFFLSKSFFSVTVGTTKKKNYVPVNPVIQD